MNEFQKVKEVLADKVYDGIDKSTKEVNVFQKRPFTMVELIVHLPEGTTIGAVGFSKVMAPDVWDEQRGEDIAYKKARRQIARIIMKQVHPTLDGGYELENRPAHIPLYTTRKRLRRRLKASKEAASGLVMDEVELLPLETLEKLAVPAGQKTFDWVDAEEGETVRNRELMVTG